ncbi:hypothetical protein B5M09_008255 [Aphanomyces astaci]|uniref:Uncharacterized protein n=1 Tax=Aphanomyces astaci TaxID=112090 RepID=A0A3R7XPX3_APHAT|nr:hypothetical protein B5M09_008255 [Aphanomyces astaci]
MGDADKAQHLGMTTAVDQQLSEIEYLMCFYRVIKKCYEKDADCELTNEEWRDVSFYIYLLHMSASHVDMGDLMEALKYRTDLKRLQATITYAGLDINFFHAEYESVMDFLIFLNMNLCLENFAVSDQVFVDICTICITQYGETIEVYDSTSRLIDKVIQVAGDNGFLIMTNFTSPEFEVLWNVVQVPLTSRWTD